MFAGTERRPHLRRNLIMTDTEKLSRRGFFARAVIFTAGMTAGLGATLKSAAAKMTQKAALYQNKPKEGAKCATCTHFQPPASCNIVAGTISPNGWCQMYIKK